MIKIFNDYYDEKGHRYKVISFNGDKYSCQSYSTGKTKYFAPNELFDKPKKEIKKKEVVIEETNITEPVYNYSPEPEYKIEEKPTVQKEIELKDNSEETAGDFYADL